MKSSRSKEIHAVGRAPAEPPQPRAPGDLLDQVHDGVVVVGLDGLVHTWNASAERIYGYTAAEMIGQPIVRLFFPEDEPLGIAQALETLRAQPMHQATELRVCRKGGAEIFVDLRLSLQRDEQGRAIGVIGCSHDVTARIRARRDERRQREELRVILDGMPAMVWYKDRDNNIVRVNAAAAASVGRAPKDVEGRSTAELFPEEAEKYHRDDLEVIDSGVAKTGIIEMLQTASGEKRWVKTDKFPYRDERGAIVGVLVFAVDITEQKQAQQAFEQACDTLEERVRERTAALAAANAGLRSEIDQRRQAERRLEMALWATGLGMWEWDAHSGFAVADQQWAAMLGYRLEEIEQPGRFWQALVHPDDRAQLERAWTAHVVEARTPYFEVVHRVRAKSGDYRWMLTRGRVYERAADGKSLRLAGTNLDITSRKQIEEQAARHQAELAHLLRLQTVNCLAAELAHEINQPLGAIANYANGLAERLRQGQIDRFAMLEAAEHIGAQALRAGTVLQRLREFVRKDSPRQRVADLNGLVASAAGLVEAEARRRRVTLVLQLGANLPPVRVDAIQIEQVLVNLLRNGLEAIAGASGEVLVSTAATATGVEGRVRDSGGGVPEAARERLFEPFFTTKAEGLGMGLSISRSIVDAHGGSMHVDPLDGPGATFSFVLPTDPQHAPD
jgi:PAS domain S-box-containing protein